jgi:hypothetical protein
MRYGAYPWSIEFDENILIVIDNDVIIVVGNDNGNWSVLYFGDRFALDAG